MTPLVGCQAGSSRHFATSSRQVDCKLKACVALTYDDGPGELTPRLLDELAAAKAPATFFLIGASAQRHPDTVARIAAAGHEIGNHTQDHVYLHRQDAAGQQTQVAAGQASIEAAGGRATLLRPPFGSYDDVTGEVARAAGLPIVLWDVDTRDWQHHDAQTTRETAIAQAKRGSIILMHDVHDASVDATPAIIEGLRARGFTLATVSDVLRGGEPGLVYTDGS